MLIHKRILTLIRGSEAFLLSKSFLGLLILATYIGQAIFLGHLLGQLYENKSLSEMKANLILVVAMLLSRVFLVWVNQLYGKWIVGRIKNILRTRAYHKLCDLGPAYLTEARTGELESAIVAGVDYLEGYIGQYLPQIVVCWLGSGAILVYIWSIHPLLGAICLVSALIALFSPVFFLTVIDRTSNEHWEAYQDLNAEFVDNLQGMMTLKALNASGRVGTKLRTRMRGLFHKTMVGLRINLAEVGIAGFAASLGSAFTLGLAAYYTATGTLNIEELGILLFLTSVLYQPIQTLGTYFHQGFMGWTASDGILTLLDEVPSVQDAKKTSKKHVFQGGSQAPSIHFKSVDFSYPGSKEPLFQNLTLDVAAGERIALVGESGSGKSSLINLLMRFYDPDAGQILIDNTDLRDIPLTELRRQAAIVSQDTWLFKGSVAENLRLAKPEATVAELEAAARAAQIHEEILAMPEGYESILGERGINLSGGQKQRLAIARALLKNSPLIILDEATASVDEANEHLIQTALDSLLTGKTCLTIAHRLSTVRRADRILVMSRGRIVESGSHDELMAVHGSYWQLVQAQG